MAAPSASVHATRTGERVEDLAGISIADDSSWRDVDEERVEQPVRTVEDGNFGKTSLAGPSLIAENGVPTVSSEDGRLRLLNGKRWVAALQRKHDWRAGLPATEKANQRAELAWLVAPLVDALEKGLSFTVYDLAPYERLSHQTVQALSHEARATGCLFFAGQHSSSPRVIHGRSRA